MSDDQMIAAQARRISALEAALSVCAYAASSIRLEIFGIGGPLNDNKLGYSREQWAPFWRISEHTNTMRSAIDEAGAGSVPHGEVG